MPTIPIRGRWIVAIPFLCAPALAQVDPHGSLSTWPTHLKRPLFDLDVRLAADGTPAPGVSERNGELRRADALAARSAELAALRARIPLLRVEDHALFGTPHWIASTATFLTPPARDDVFDAVEVTRAFVAAHPGLFEVVPEELELARRERDYLTRHNGVRHLTFQQQIGGVDLYGAELRANVTRHGELINVSSTMLPRPEGDFQPAATRLSALQAIHFAAQSIEARITVEPSPLRAARGDARVQEWSGTPDFRSDMPVKTEFLYFPMTREDIRPAWRVTLPEIGVGNTYEVVVDASTGTILHRQNQLDFLVGGTQNLTVNVYTKDSPAPGSPGNSTPNGFQFPLVPRTLVLVTPASVPESPNSWINDNDTDTQGNNVDGHTDLDANNQPDLPRPNGGAGRVFDFPQDNAQAPALWRAAATTNLFYFCNIYHDKLYGFGFDEAAGNFQNDNFGLGGLGNDRVQADCQDGSGTNNANFGTPPDGQSGRMQQYVFTGPNPFRDSDLDSDIVYHEHSHGLSNRLHNLQVNGTQAGGMGEGWGDFFGVALNAEPTDDPLGAYHTGGYTVFQLVAGYIDNYYFGIRRFPYCTNPNINPQTFADIDPAQQSYPPAVPRSNLFGNTANEVHNVGEVWCNMLLEARANLWAAHGFAGNDLIMQLVTDGMKLDPGTPNFLEARDSILQADIVNNGGANLGELWAAFATRGCGYSATSPSGSTSTGVVEAFDTPVAFEYPNGRPTQLLPNQTATFQVNIAGIGSLQPISGTGQLHVSVNGGPFNPIAMTETSTNHYDATLPAGACLDTYRYYVSTDTSTGTAVNPSGAPANTFPVTVFSGTAVYLADDFQADTGWTTSVSGATAGAWQRGVPVDDPGSLYDPHADSDGSGMCFLTENALGITDVDGGSVILLSPVFDMTGGGDVKYDYYLNLNDEASSDRLRVEINATGGSGAWAILANHTTSGGTSWRTNSISMATIQGLGVPFTAAMRLRFTATDGAAPSIVEAGVDGVLVAKLLCDDGVIGTYFCPADGTVGLCPCVNQGGPSSGCDNSIGTGGASIVATGTTNPDTVVLTATNELPSALTIFLQGNLAIFPVTYGDGVRCVGGTVKRLYSHNASSGTVFAPQPGEASITARSAAIHVPITPGQTRYYMTYYRDMDPSFCGPQTFNGSNAVALLW